MANEHGLQLAVTAFLKAALPPEVVWTAVDHGAGRMSKAAAGQRKARGVKRGQADYRFILPPHGLSCEIELKVEGTYQRPEQKDWARAVNAAGGRYAVCRSVQQVADILTDWGFPLRGRVAA